MSNFITIGKGLVPPEQIALVEMFDPAANPRFQPKRDYQARVVMLNRESILVEEAVHSFALTHDFRVIEGDKVAVNPAVRFRVETFTPGEDFNPSKPYRTRIRWRDLDGNDQSKLLLTEPEDVLAVVESAAPESAPDQAKPKRAKRRRLRVVPPAPAA